MHVKMSGHHRPSESRDGKSHGEDDGRFNERAFRRRVGTRGVIVCMRVVGDENGRCGGHRVTNRGGGVLHGNGHVDDSSMVRVGAHCLDLLSLGR